ncbi:hypothetical protein [Tepidibacillus marianensis]|uniref:hypothetical protein n=1 Tax=Tepidibacillus marianensis TaxID=3131995 RepID=UPI0030D355C5
MFQSPQMIIWTPGTPLSLWLGIIFALLFSLYQMKKKNLPWMDVFHLTWLTVMMTLFLYYLVIKEYGKMTSFVNIYRAIWLGLLFVFYARWLKNLTYSRLMLLFMGLGFGLLVLSIFDVNTDLMLGLSQNQWMALLFGLIGVIGFVKKKEGAN